MTDLMLQMSVSNLITSTAIALLAWTAQSTGRGPRLAHGLWVLVLVSLATPPLVHVPLIPVPGVEPATADVVPAATTSASASAGARSALSTPSIALRPPTPDAGIQPDPPAGQAAATLPRVAALLGAAWLIGSLAVLAWTLTGVIRFERRLGSAMRPAPPTIQRLAADTAARFGLRRSPPVVLVDATVSPMLWWAGRRPRIIIPAALLERIPAAELRWILAHELAHVRRRDHLVRWIECLVLIGFWWNPLVWWARRNLRLNEELCCDALVLETLQTGPSPARGYARALLHVVEFMAAPALRPPALASAVNGGGILETRFTMIMTPDTRPRSPRWLTAVAMTAAAAMLPMGFAYADADVEAVTKRLRAAVEAGELESAQARLMLRTLKQAEAESGEREAADRRMRGEYEQAIAELKQAVDRGRLSEKDAASRLEAMRDRMEERKRMQGRDTAELEKLEQAAAQRARDARRREGGPAAKERVARMQAEFERAMVELKEMVAAGRANPDEADRRIAEMKARMERMAAQMKEQAAGGRTSHGDLRERFAQIERELDQAVANGRITPDEARRRLEEAQRAMKAEAEHSERRERRERDRDRAMSRDRDSDRDRDRSVDRESARSSDRDDARSSDRDRARSRTQRATRSDDRAKAVREATRAIEAELRSLVKAGHLKESDARARLEMLKQAMQASPEDGL